MNAGLLPVNAAAQAIVVKAIVAIAAYFILINLGCNGLMQV